MHSGIPVFKTIRVPYSISCTSLWIPIIFNRFEIIPTGIIRIIEKGIKGKLEEIYGIEETVFYPEKYAGTADLIGKFMGQEVCIDFKQSNKPKKSDYIQDYFLQLGAYTLAHDVVHGTKMKAGVILLCTVDNLYQEFKIEGAELEMYQNLFLGRVKKFYEISNTS